MADTIRTRADLQLLLADNVTGDISAQDVRDFLVSVHGVHGGLYKHDAAGTQMLTGATPEVIAPWDSATAAVKGVTPDNVAGEIEVGTAGDYYVQLQTSFEITNPTLMTFHVRVNGSESNYACQINATAGSISYSASCSALLSLSGSDVVSAWVEAGVDTDYTPSQAQLIVRRWA